MFSLTVITLAAAILLGGGTHTGFLGDVLVQAAAIPLLMAALWRMCEHSRQPTRHWRAIVVVLATTVCLYALYLVPLPNAWSALDRLVADVPLAHASKGWRALSLTPAASWASAVSLLPPLAIFAATTQLTARERVPLSMIVVATGAIAVMIGLLQVAQGPASPLRFFAITNKSEAVGFFANRNHFAAHLYVALVFAVVWFLPLIRDRHGTLTFDSRALLWLSAAAAFLMAIIAGLVMARSRAGIALAIIAILAITLIAARTRPARDGEPKRRYNLAMQLTAAMLTFSLLFAAQFGMQRLQSRLGVDVTDDLRIPLTRTTLETVLATMPFGTGPSSFVHVYATAEHASDVFTGFANRAHNDIAEFALETSAAGIILMMLFGFWYVMRASAIWRRDQPDRIDQHRLLQMAATVVILLLAAHSFVDYPLRTTALVSVFAFACGVLIDPPTGVRIEAKKQRASQPRDSRRRSKPATPGPRTPTQTVAAPSSTTPRRSHVDWPDAWKDAWKTADAPTAQKPRRPWKDWANPPDDETGTS